MSVAIPLFSEQMLSFIFALNYKYLAYRQSKLTLVLFISEHLLYLKLVSGLFNIDFCYYHYYTPLAIELDRSNPATMCQTLVQYRTCAHCDVQFRL